VSVLERVPRSLWRGVRPRASTVLLIGVLGMFSALAVPEARPAHGQQPVAIGQVPGPGSIGLLVTAAPTTAVQLTVGLQAQGCDVAVLAVIVSGQWRVHIVGAPATVNAGFPQLPATAPFFVRCAAGPLAIVTLPDGTACRHAGSGATLTFQGQRANYTCGSAGGQETVLLGALSFAGQQLTVTRGVIGRDASGFVLLSSQQLAFQIERVTLYDNTTCAFAGSGATLAFAGRRVNYTCTGPLDVLLGDFAASGDVVNIERGTVGRDTSGFVLLTSAPAGVREIDGRRTIDPRTAADPRNATYEVEGRAVTLVNGLSEVEAAPGSASKVSTRYFGNEATGDLNGDGVPDVGFVLTQSTGGSGTFYYAAAALKTPAGYLGTNAVLLGDRIAPQTTEIRAGTLIVNYADRKPGEPMTSPPSVGVSKYLKIVGGRLVE
jgi:hypothetical protein